MVIADKAKDKIRASLRSFLNITPAPEYTVQLDLKVDRLANCAKNRIWYWGQSQQIADMYKQLEMPSTMFWKAKPTRGQDIRKIHSGLPGLMVHLITKIVTNDFNGVEIDTSNGTALSERWEEIASKNDFESIFEQAVTDIGIVGDGAFKISYDKSIQDMPIIEWFPSEQVEFTYRRNKIIEVIFKTEIVEDSKKYYLTEAYGYGFIKYTLFNANKKEITINSIRYTQGLGEGVTFDKSYMWAVPVLYNKQSMFKGRGKSLLDGKEDAFDAFDEAWSQWMDSLRASRPKIYIPQNLIPVDTETLKFMPPNPFDNRFIAVAENGAQGADNHIVTETPIIQYEAFLQTYMTALDLCLQGVISPSTLGIDTKKLDNAEAQREKEKATLYTRQNFVEIMSKALPALVQCVLNADNELHGKSVVNDVQVSVNFGEYANPSFESQVETVGKAKQSGVMSTEQAVEELYGDSKDSEWKTQEVARIKAEQGIAELDEGSEIDDIQPIGF